MKNILKIITLSSCSVLSATSVHAASSPTLGYADVVLDYFNSGAGSLSGPYGGLYSPGPHPVSVTTDIVLGNNSGYLSLPTGSFVTVGFTDETIVDGPGNDLFISEVGGGRELADVFISSNLTDFIFLGQANGASITSFDFTSIGFTDPVQAVKIVGLDNGGSSPGFDVVYIQALTGSIGAPPITSPIPEPSSIALMLGGLGLVGFMAARRRKEA